MTRYIDADALLTDEMLHTIPFGSGKSSGRVIIFVDEIEKLIVEDVVPKSEVYRLQKQISDLNEKNAQLALKLFKDFPTEKELEIYEVYEKTKYSVAREIFEEIEKEIEEALKSNYKVLQQLEFSNELYNSVRGKIDALRGIEGFIAELKKKYTEVEK